MKLLPWLPGVIPAACALLNVIAVQAGWQTLDQHPAWLALPWNWIGIAAVFCLLGVLVAQAQNPRSPIRSRRTWRRVLPDLAASMVPNSGWLIHVDVGGQTERSLLWVRDFKQTNGLGMVVATPGDIARARGQVSRVDP